MTIAYHTGTPPQRVRDEWSWRDILEFLLCLPGIQHASQQRLWGDHQ